MSGVDLTVLEAIDPNTALVLAQRQRWALGRMVLGGHRQVVLVRPADTTLVLHVLHYPEHVRVCPQTVWPMKQEPQEELRLAGMLIDRSCFCGLHVERTRLTARVRCSFVNPVPTSEAGLKAISPSKTRRQTEKFQGG
jgi:hypothetical protein